jgi:hypothetical protein
LAPSGVVYFDPDLRKFFWLRSTDSEPRELSGTDLIELQRSGVLKPQEVFTYFDQPRTTGTDFKFQPQARFVLTIDPAINGVDRMLQASMRSRQFLSTQNIDIVILDSAKGALLGNPLVDDDEKKVALDNFDRLILTLQRNQSRNIVRQQIQATRDKLHNLLHSFLLDVRTALLCPNGEINPSQLENYRKVFQRMCEYPLFRKIVVTNDAYDPVAMFHNLCQWKNADDLMRNYWRALSREFYEMFHGNHPSLAEDLEAALGDRWTNDFAPLLGNDGTDTTGLPIEQRADQIITSVNGLQIKSSSDAGESSNRDAQVTVEVQQQQQQEQEMEMELQLELEAQKQYYRELDGNGARTEVAWIHSSGEPAQTFAEFLAKKPENHPTICSLPQLIKNPGGSCQWAKDQALEREVIGPGSIAATAMMMHSNYTRYADCFTEDMQVTSNFAFTCEEPLPVFHGTQKNMLFLLIYIDKDNKKRALAVSYQEAQDLRREIEDGHLKDCWLISQMGENASQVPLPSGEEMKQFCSRVVWQANLFDCNVAPLYFTRQTNIAVGQSIARELASNHENWTTEDIQKLWREFLILRYENTDSLDPSRPPPSSVPKAANIAGNIEIFSQPIPPDRGVVQQPKATLKNPPHKKRVPLPKPHNAINGEVKSVDLNPLRKLTSNHPPSSVATKDVIVPPKQQPTEQQSTAQQEEGHSDPPNPLKASDSVEPSEEAQIPKEKTPVEATPVEQIKTWNGFKIAAVIFGAIAALAIIVGILLVSNVIALSAGVLLGFIIISFSIGGVSAFASIGLGVYGVFGLEN